MSWVNPRTWVSSELVTAALLNAQVRDNLSALWPYTTTGDLAYKSASATLARLGIGTEGQVLAVSSGGLPAWETRTKVNFVSSGTEAWENTSWDGDSHSVGTESFYPNDFNSNIPNTAKAIVFSLSGRWTTASDGSTLNVAPWSGNDQCLLIRAQVSNFFQDNYGTVPVGNDGKIYVKIAGATCNAVYLKACGYFI